MNQTTIEKIVRYVLGLLLAVFGLNKFMPLMDPPSMGAKAGEVMAGLSAAGYIMPLVGIIFIGVAVLLFINRAVPFGLVLVAPIVVNIVLFHLCASEVSSITPGLLIGVLVAVLAWSRRGAFSDLFSSRAPSRAA